MAVLDFPSDTSQSPYEENGITYEWDGQKWIITSGGSGGGGGGDLTLQEVTDNGNITTNGATFGGDVEVGDRQSTTDNFIWNYLNPTGNNPQLVIRAKDTAQASSSLLVAGTQSNPEAIQLKATGSAEFAGVVTIDRPAPGGGFTPVAQNALLVENAGTCQAKIAGDGSVKIGGTLSSSTSGDTEQGNITLNADGSAEFAATGIFRGDIVGGNYLGNDAARTGLYWDTTNNVFNIKTPTPATSNSALRIWQGTSPGAPTVSINSNGSASFASNVEVNQLISNSYILGGYDGTDLKIYGASNSTKGMTLDWDGTLNVDNGVSAGSDIQLVDGSPRIILNYAAPNATTVCPQITSDGERFYYFGKSNTANSAHVFYAGGGNPEMVRIDQHGLKFNGDTSSLNALDDYEEGTWTPIAGGNASDGTATYSKQVGTYTKVGRMVTIHADLSWTSCTATGNIRIKGLPFQAGPNVHPAVTFGFQENLTISANNTLGGFIEPNSSFIIPQATPTGGGTSAEIAVDAAANIMFSATYFTA